jgi:hypothetical protein
MINWIKDKYKEWTCEHEDVEMMHLPAMVVCKKCLRFKGKRL